MSLLKNPRIPVLVTSLAAIIMIIDYYLTSAGPISTIASNFKSFNSIMMSFTLFVGSVSLVILNVRKVTKPKKEISEVVPPAALLGTMALVVGLWLATGSTTSTEYQWLYTAILQPSEASLYGLVGFFMAYAAYKGFRVRNLESAAMLITGIFVMLALTSAAGAVWDGFPIIGDWFKDVPGMAGGRAFGICAAVGTIVMGTRILLGKERLLGRR
jgi:hypothetical protein